MQRRSQRLLATTTLSLAALAGCDRATDPELASTPRSGGAVLGAPRLDCLGDAKLQLHHDDGTSDVTSDLTVGLAELARPGDLLELSFVVDATCAAAHGPRVTLASYTTPGVHYGLDPVTPPTAYDVHTARLVDGDTQTLSVRLPSCFYELDLAFGPPLPTLEPSKTYETQSRLVIAAEGGHGTCGEPSLALERFDPAGPGWGDAPLSTHFGWKIDAEPGTPLRCEFDFDADGTIDHVREPCIPSTENIKTVQLPQRSYGAGKHRPEMIVSDGQRRLWATTDIYSNHLEYKPEVRFLEQLPAFDHATVVTKEAPDPSTVVLHFKESAAVPEVQPGEVVVGHGGAQGYMLRVESAEQDDTSLVLTGQPADLRDVVASGFFGVRDVQIDTSGARCLGGDCSGTITPVDDAPTGPGDVPVRGRLASDDPLLDPGDGKDGIQFTIPLGELGYGELTIFAGVLVDAFEIDAGFLSIDSTNIKLTPAVTAALSVKKARTFSVDGGTYVVGVLPTPIPLTIELNPRLDFQAALRFSATATLRAPVSAVKENGEWHNELDVKYDAGLDPEEGAEVSGTIKATAVPAFQLALGFLNGPYVAPTVSLGLKAAINNECEACLTAFSEAGGEFGWTNPFGSGALFDPLKLVFSVRELWQECALHPNCEPPLGDPPEGGAWGDVHLVSYDGLLFDFQAGGEFVLTRATEGAPFEVQTRQEPLGTDYSLSINTAVATVVDGRRVGIYTRVPAGLFIDGVATPLAPGSSLALGGGQIERDAAGLYTLTYPSGERVYVRPGSSLNVEVDLPAARAGKVVGLLGDADGLAYDDIALSAGTHLSQPVTEQQLYRDENSFAAAWRVDPAASLFDYAVGTSATTYRESPYIDMPIGDSSAQPPFADLALDLCESCPEQLRDTCMLDVGITGEPDFAEACHYMQVPSDLLLPADGVAIVSPRNGAALECDPYTGLVFRAHGAADPDDPNTFTITLRAYHQYNGWSEYTVDTSILIGNPEWILECEPIGDGSWGECTFKPADNPCGFGGWAWSNHHWSVTAHVPPPVGSATDVAFFTVP